MSDQLNGWDLVEELSRKQWSVKEVRDVGPKREKEPHEDDEVAISPDAPKAAHDVRQAKEIVSGDHSLNGHSMIWLQSNEGHNLSIYPPTSQGSIQGDTVQDQYSAREFHLEDGFSTRSDMPSLDSEMMKALALNTQNQWHGEATSQLRAVPEDLKPYSVMQYDQLQSIEEGLVGARNSVAIEAPAGINSVNDDLLATRSHIYDAEREASKSSQIDKPVGIDASGDDLSSERSYVYNAERDASRSEEGHYQAAKVDENTAFDREAAVSYVQEQKAEVAQKDKWADYDDGYSRGRGR